MDAADVLKTTITITGGGNQTDIAASSYFMGFLAC